MTETLNINDISTEIIIKSIKSGDEILLEENGKPIAKITPIKKPKEVKKRTAGLGKGTMWMSEDFDDELPDEFWGIDKEL